MSRALSGVFLALLMIPPALAQTTGTPADHEALSRLKADAVAAVNQRDYTVAQRILHRPFMATLITQDSFTDFDALKDYFESLYIRDFNRIARIAMTAEADEYSQIYQGTFALTKGSTKEHYELASGQTFDVAGRWTAVSMKDGADWKLLAVHTGTNFLDNPVLHAVERSVLWFGAGGLALGLMLGFAGGWLLRRKRA